MSVARPSAVPGALDTSDDRRAASAGLRALTTAFLSREVDDETMQWLTATFRAATEALTAGTERVRSFAEINREPEADDVPDGGELGHFDGCFVTGEASPIGLTARVHCDGDGLVGRFRVPRPFEGMPGYAHGGILLAAFDDLIGLTMGRLMRVSAPTVRVEVDFRRPVPLDTEVVVRTKLASTDGRKRTVAATASVGDTVHAEARGLLVVLPPDHSIGA